MKDTFFTSIAVVAVSYPVVVNSENQKDFLMMASFMELLRQAVIFYQNLPEWFIFRRELFTWVQVMKM